jgi:hypothetical protein
MLDATFDREGNEQIWGRTFNFHLYHHLTLLASSKSSLPINLMLGSQRFDFHTSLPNWDKNQRVESFNSAS